MLPVENALLMFELSEGPGTAAGFNDLPGWMVMENRPGKQRALFSS